MKYIPTTISSLTVWCVGADVVSRTSDERTDRLRNSVATVGDKRPGMFAVLRQLLVLQGVKNKF